MAEKQPEKALSNTAKANYYPRKDLDEIERTLMLDRLQDYNDEPGAKDIVRAAFARQELHTHANVVMKMTIYAAGPEPTDKNVHILFDDDEWVSESGDELPPAKTVEQRNAEWREKRLALAQQVLKDAEEAVQILSEQDNSASKRKKCHD